MSFKIESNQMHQEYYKLIESGDEFTFKPLAREEKETYSPLETLKLIEANLDKLKANEKTLECVDSILNGYVTELKKLEESYKKTWSNTFKNWGLKKNDTEENIHKNWNKAIALSQQIKAEWKEMGGRIPDIFLGKAFVKTVDGQRTEQVDIFMGDGSYGQKIFRASIEGRSVGTMTIDWFRKLPSGIYGSDGFSLGVESYMSDAYYTEDLDHGTPKTG